MSRATLKPAARAAVEWMARLQSGAVSEHERHSFEAWRTGDARHAAAWAELESVQQMIRAPLARGLSPQQVQALIPPPPPQVLTRRSALGAALGMGAIALTAALVDRSTPLGGLMADLSTGTGVRRSVNLDDGSRLVLNARSAVDLLFDDARSTLTLRNGLIYFDTAAGTGGATLKAPTCSVLLADGACNLYSDDGICRVDMTRGSARFVSAGNALLLHERDSVVLGPQGLRRFTTEPSAAHSWLEGRLVVHDESLAQVVRMLRPYWAGLLHLDEQVADLSVTGVFPLADTWQSLRSLAATLPIRVDRRAGYWIRVGGAI